MDELNEGTKEVLRIKQTELIRIISAFVELNKSKEWQVLKELVFDRALGSIERQMLIESRSRVIDSNKLYKLQGEHDWALRYANLDKFIEYQKIQLENIKKQLK